MVYIIQKGIPERIMDILTLLVAECKSLVNPMKPHVKLHKKDWEKLCLMQTLQKEFLEATYQTVLERERRKLWQAPQKQVHHPKVTQMKKVETGAITTLSVTIGRVTELALQRQRAAHMVIETVSLQMRQLWRYHKSAHRRLKLQVLKSRGIRQKALMNRRNRRSNCKVHYQVGFKATCSDECISVWSFGSVFYNKVPMCVPDGVRKLRHRW